MTKIGAHAFVWIGEWTADAGDHAIQQARATGFDLLEVPMLDPDNFDAKRHRASLDAANIEATCSLVLPEGAHMPEAPENAKAFLLKALDKVDALGARYLGGCIAYSLGRLTGEPPRQDERDVVIDVLGEVAEEAAKLGITLALEACNRYETYMYNTLADAAETIRAVGAANLKLHADTYHMNIEEQGFIQPFVDTADVINYVHMSESHRGLVGSGTVDWEQVWKGLAEARFDGYLVLESFAAINPALAAATCLWRPPSQTSDTIAREGRARLLDGARRYGLLD